VSDFAVSFLKNKKLLSKRNLDFNIRVEENENYQNLYGIKRK